MNLDAWRHYLRGRLLRLLRRREAALAEFRAAFRCDRGTVRFAHALAYELAGHERWGEARELLEEVVRATPGSGVAWFNLGFARQQLGDKVAAVQAFEEAVRHGPKLDRAWFGLGLARTALGDDAAAVKAFEEAALLQEMNPHVWYELGMAWYRLHDPGKLEAVIRHLHRFHPIMTRRLILDTERTDLLHLVRDLKV